MKGKDFNPNFSIKMTPIPKGSHNRVILEGSNEKRDMPKMATE
jgi:hypothetical protein